MVIGRKNLIEGIAVDLSDSMEGILLIGGQLLNRISYLHRMLVGLYPSPFHKITVFDTDINGALSQRRNGEDYKILPYDQCFDIFEEISRREGAFVQKKFDGNFPKLTYVFNDLDRYKANYSDRHLDISESLPPLFSLFDDLERLRRLDIRIIIVSESINFFSNKTQLDSFRRRFYLGGFTKEEESLLLGEPCYISQNAKKLVYYHYGLLDVFGLPLENDIPDWAIDELSEIKNDSNDYVLYSRYLCLYCGEEVLTISNYACQRCEADSLLSIAVGKLILDSIDSVLPLGKEVDGFNVFGCGTDLEIAVRKDVLEKADLIDYFKLIKNKTEYSNAAFNRDFHRVFVFYYTEYKKIVNGRKEVGDVFLKEVRVTQLFGNESFAVNFESKDHLSILYGTNAFGKTTLLKIISSLLANISDNENVANFQFLMSVPFNSVEVVFSNDTYLLVSKSTSIERHPQRLSIVYIYKDADNDDRLFVYDDDDMIGQINLHFSSLRRLVGNKKVLFIGANRVLDASEIIRLFASNLSARPRTISMSDVSYTNLKRIYDSQIKMTAFKGVASFVHSKRLTLNRLVSRVKNEIIANNVYLRNSGAGVPITKEALEKVRELLDFGVLPERDKSLIEDPSNLVLKNESNERLFAQGSPYPRRFYKRILESIDAMYEFYKRFIVFKELFESFYDDFNPSKKTISLQGGTLILKASDNKSLKLTNLSTGENNVVSILRSLIFDLSNDSILFIDEPEISLHIAWQIKLMEIITERMENNNKIQVVIATHSPYIGTYHENSLAKVKVTNV